MNAITPTNPVQQHIDAETAKMLSRPISFASNRQSGTLLLCRSRGGVGVSTTASAIFYLAGAELNGTFIEVSGMPGYAHRAHKGARFHINGSEDGFAKILDIRIARLSELTIIELEPAYLQKTEELYRLLTSTIGGPVHIIYVADENEDYPTFVQHIAKVGLKPPMVVTKPTAAMQKSDIFVTTPRLGGDIKSGFYRDRLSLSQAIAASSQHGSKLILNHEMLKFRAQLEAHCNG